MQIRRKLSSTPVNAIQSVPKRAGPEVSGAVLVNGDYHGLVAQPPGEASVFPRFSVHSIQSIVGADPKNSFMILINGVYKIRAWAVGVSRLVVERFKLRWCGAEMVGPF